MVVLHFVFAFTFIRFDHKLNRPPWNCTSLAYINDQSVLLGIFLQLFIIFYKKLMSIDFIDAISLYDWIKLFKNGWVHAFVVEVVEDSP